MPTPAPDSWFTRDEPVLYATAKLFQEMGRASIPDIAVSAGVSEEDAMRSLASLANGSPPFLVGQTDMNGMMIYVHEMTERGLQRTGIWPSEDHAKAFLRILSTMADAAAPDERTKLRAFGAAASNVGEQTIAALIAGVLQSMR